MEHETDSPLAFHARPPSCLELLGDEKVDLEKVEKGFRDEAQNLRIRLSEQLAQLRIELGLFLRLMYKNKNQHRRTLYYQRLSEVRRDMQLLSKSGLDETVESFAMFFTSKRPDGVSSKAVTQFKLKDAIDERKALRTLLSVARLLNQSNGRIMAGSAQLAGLLGQSFFMPFALTMFSCLARFRVLLIQVLYEVVTAFNLLSIIWQRKQKSLMYSVEGKSVSASSLGQNQLPAELTCHWDGVKLSVTEKKTSSVRDCRKIIPDILVEPSQLWFVDDRTGVKCELQVPASIARPSAELLQESEVLLHVNQGKLVVSELETTTNFAPLLEVRPDICRPDPKDNITGLSADDFTPATATSDGVEDVSPFNVAVDQPCVLPTIQCGVTALESSESSGLGQVGPQILDYRPDARTSSAARSSVAYRSISHKIVKDSTSSGNSTLQIGAKRKGMDICTDQEARCPAKSELKKAHVDSKDRSESNFKEEKTNDIFAMLLGGSD